MLESHLDCDHPEPTVRGHAEVSHWLKVMSRYISGEQSSCKVELGLSPPSKYGNRASTLNLAFSNGEIGNDLCLFIMFNNCK